MGNNYIHGQDTTEKTPEPLEVGGWDQKAQRNATRPLHCSPHTSPAPHREVFLSWHILQWEKGGGEELKMISSNPSIVGHSVGASIMVSLHRGYRGIYKTQTVGIWLWQRSGEGHPATTQILTDQVSTCTAEGAGLISSYAHLQTLVQVRSDPGTDLGARVPDLGPQTRSSSGPGVWSAQAQAGTSVIAPPTAEHGPQPYLTERVGRMSGSCITQQHSRWETSKQSWSPPKQNQQLCSRNLAHRSVWTKTTKNGLGGCFPTALWQKN